MTCSCRRAGLEGSTPVAKAVVCPYSESFPKRAFCNSRNSVKSGFVANPIFVVVAKEPLTAKF